MTKNDKIRVVLEIAKRIFQFWKWGREQDYWEKRNTPGTSGPSLHGPDDR